MRHTRLIELAKRVGQRFRDDRGMQIASSLTFTTLLALVPIITIALTLITAFPVFAEMSGALKAFVLQNMLPQSADAVAKYAQQFTTNAARLTAVGIGLLSVTAILLLMTIDRAFNDIWRVRHPRPIIQRVVVYWTLLTVGPVLVGASLTITSWLVARSVQLVGGIPGAAVVLLTLVPFLLTSLALALLYLTMPNRRIAPRDALIGGFLAGLAFEVMKRGFAFYITSFPTYKLVYGAFATVPVFLLWVYLSWLVVVFGAVVVAVLPEWRERAGSAEPAPGSDFFDALQILRVLWLAHRDGKVVRMSELFGTVKVRIERIEAMLESMIGATWITRAAPRGWVLSRDPAFIKVADVFRLFVFNAEHHIPARHADAELEAMAHDVSARIAADLALSLDELFGKAEEAQVEAMLLDAPHGRLERILGSRP
ncbi:MAG TPA: YihY family inner membrane protein [Burkholderiales bacterium]|nr:YihY family inner membrane protein [Burkholderiales bacterium]